MFNPLNFGGNPAVMELLQSPLTDIDQLLQFDNFPSEFKSNNSKLISYMDDSKYRRLVSYITQLGDPEQKNRSYKFPLMASEILGIDNSQTLQYMFREGPIFVDQIIVEEVWVQKEVDECDSQYYSSTGSNRKLEEDFFQQENQQNVPPQKRQRNSLEPKTNTFEDETQKKVVSPANSQNSHNSSSASITSDDFPFVEAQKKLIKVKKVQTKKIKKEVKPLLDEIFQYFEGQVNYTLSGYIGKVIENLLKKEPYKLLRYIYHNKKEKKILNHIESPSISQFISKMLLVDMSSFEDERRQFYEHIMETFLAEAILQKNVRIPCLSSALCEIINKTNVESINLRNFLKALYDPKLLMKIPQACTMNFSLPYVCSVIQAYLKKVDTINKINEGKKELKALLILNLQSLFNDFIIKMWDKMKQELSSASYIGILEIVNYLIRENLFWTRVQLQQQNNIGDLLIKVCKKYPKNNILHVQIFQLFKLAVINSESCPGISKNIFQSKSFLVFLLQAMNHKELLYRGQCIQLCELLKQTSTATVKQFKENAKWQKIKHILVDQLHKYSKTLGGHSAKRPQKHAVMFQKQAILTKYDCFLKNQLPEKAADDDDESEDLMSSCHSNIQWSDWNDFSSYNTDQVND